jgi:hypothetical protein
MRFKNFTTLQIVRYKLASMRSRPYLVTRFNAFNEISVSVFRLSTFRRLPMKIVARIMLNCEVIMDMRKILYFS